jgi:hypothetical protein
MDGSPAVDPQVVARLLFRVRSLYTWWADKPWKEADKELEGYASLLRDKSGERKEGAEGLVGTPIGSDGLQAELAREMIPYSAEELIAVARREFAWCESG